jgi:hypothetical protein
LELEFKSKTADEVDKLLKLNELWKSEVKFKTVGLSKVIEREHKASAP